MFSLQMTQGRHCQKINNISHFKTGKSRQLPSNSLLFHGMVEKVLFGGQIFEIEITMNLHVMSVP